MLCELYVNKAVTKKKILKCLFIVALGLGQ